MLSENPVASCQEREWRYALLPAQGWAGSAGARAREPRTVGRRAGGFGRCAGAISQSAAAFGRAHPAAKSNTAIGMTTSRSELPKHLAEAVAAPGPVLSLPKTPA